MPTKNLKRFFVPSYYDETVENDVYGITIGLSLGDNPNLDVKIPLFVSRLILVMWMIPAFLPVLNYFPITGSTNI